MPMHLMKQGCLNVGVLVCSKNANKSITECSGYLKVREKVLHLDGVCLGCGSIEIQSKHPLFVGGLCETCEVGGWLPLSFSFSRCSCVVDVFCVVFYIYCALLRIQWNDCIDSVAIGKPERQVRKASHCGSKQQCISPDVTISTYNQRFTSIRGLSPSSLHRHHSIVACSRHVYLGWSSRTFRSWWTAHSAQR